MKTKERKQLLELRNLFMDSINKKKRSNKPILMFALCIIAVVLISGIAFEHGLNSLGCVGIFGIVCFYVSIMVCVFPYAIAEKKYKKAFKEYFGVR